MSNALDSLLAGTLDDLADMPEFKPYPAGVHKVIFDWEQKMINEKPAIEFKFKYVETLELVNATEDAPPKAGDEAQNLCMLVNNDGKPNEFSQGTIKLFVAALKDQFPGANNGEILTAAKGAEIAIVTAIRKGKDGRPDNMSIKAVHAI